MNAREIFIFAGIAALALFMLSRTRRGQTLASDVLEEVVVTGQRIGESVAGVLTPRGIRNNNPGNIDYLYAPRLNWNGTIGSDGRFAIFDTAANGVRAIGRELRASIRKGQTVRQAIHEWAPPVENDTDMYVTVVAQQIGAHPDTLLRESMLPAAALAIIKHENGQQPYDPGAVAAWVYA